VARPPLTNELGLSWPVYKAVTGHRYSKGKADYSATELLKPPRVRELERIHADEIVEDASDYVFALLGTVAHFILEIGAHYDMWDIVEEMMALRYEPGHNTKKKFVLLVNKLWKTMVTRYKSDRKNEMIVERRLYYTDPESGKKVSGQIDLVYPDTVITDYKTMSIWEGVYGLKDEKIQQLNIYNLLAREGVDAEGNPSDLDNPRQLQIVAIYRDWSKVKAFDAKIRGDKYPQRQVAVFKIERWDPEKTKKFIAERIKVHMDAEARTAAGTPLPTCTKEERWARDSKYAVMKSGRKKALRVLDSYDEALKWIDREGKGETVEERPGKSTRCQYGYCSVAPFCSQWAEISRSMEGVE
jgi:hypothetical protein